MTSASGLVCRYTGNGYICLGTGSAVCMYQGVVEMLSHVYYCYNDFEK